MVKQLESTSTTAAPSYQAISMILDKEIKSCVTSGQEIFMIACEKEESTTSWNDFLEEVA